MFGVVEFEFVYVHVTAAPPPTGIVMSTVCVCPLGVAVAAPETVHQIGRTNVQPAGGEDPVTEYATGLMPLLTLWPVPGVPDVVMLKLPGRPPPTGPVVV